MEKQNFKNHARMVPMYHYATFLLILGSIGIAIYCLCCCCSSSSCSTTGNCSGIYMLITSLSVLLVAWYARVFPLRAQDRVIRLEENLRHHQMTGKNLPSELKLSQIIALRFASDDEWLALIDRTIKENLSAKEIKQSIQNWRGDYYRV